MLVFFSEMPEIVFFNACFERAEMPVDWFRKHKKYKILEAKNYQKHKFCTLPPPPKGEICLVYP